MSFKIHTAVAAALAAISAPVFALNTTDTANPDITLRFAGASAQQDAFLVLLKQDLCNGDFDAYRGGSSGENNNFRAYSCTIKTGLPGISTAAGKKVTVYYRSSGGSAWGPVPVAANVQIRQLQVDSTCTTGASFSYNAATGSVAQPATNAFLCGTGTYTLDTDESTDNTRLPLKSVDVALADEEPKMYGYPNFPTSTRFSAVGGGNETTRQSLLNAINGNAVTGFAQVFGVVVNTTGGQFAANSNPSISKIALARIFDGTYTDWSQVPVGSVNGGVAGGVGVAPVTGPIVVCRREPGSGTQVAAHEYFLGTPQCKGLAAGRFVADTAPGTADGVVENGSGSTLNTCVETTPGAIGFASFGSENTSRTFVAIDGIRPSRYNAAAGAYGFVFETTFTKNPNVTLAAGQTEVVNYLISSTQIAANAPNTASVTALPEFNDALGQGLFVSSKAPVSTMTRGGNTCSTPTMVQGF